MRTATPPTPIMQMHQKQMQQSSLPQPPPGIQAPTSAQQASQHKRIGIGMIPPLMQLPQFQSAQQQQQQQAVSLLLTLFFLIYLFMFFFNQTI